MDTFDGKTYSEIVFLRSPTQKQYPKWAMNIETKAIEKEIIIITYKLDDFKDAKWHEILFTDGHRSETKRTS